MDFDTFLSVSQITEEDFIAETKSYAEAMASQELVIKSIITAESMVLAEDEYTAGITQLANDYGYPTTEEFLKIAKEDDIRETLLWQKVLDFVTNEAIVL